MRGILVSYKVLPSFSQDEKDKVVSKFFEKW